MAARQKKIEETKQAKEIHKKELAVKKNLKLKIKGEERKRYHSSREIIKARGKEIRKVKLGKRYIEVTTSEDDPIYIERAEVLNSKTQFLKIKNVDFKYKLMIKNQTPKIINSVLIIWERKIPFTDTLTLSKEVKVSKPIIPYELRTVEFNDLNSKREGEMYRVKIARVIFEDGSQWKNPLVRNN